MSGNQNKKGKSFADLLRFFAANPTFVPDKPGTMTRDLGQQLGHTTDTIRRNIQELEEAGYITTYQPGGPGTARRRIDITSAGKAAARNPYLGLTALEAVLEAVRRADGKWIGHVDWKEKGTASSVLAEETGFHSTTMATAVHEAHAKGLIEAESSEGDGRVIKRIRAIRDRETKEPLVPEPLPFPDDDDTEVTPEPQASHDEMDYEALADALLMKVLDKLSEKPKPSEDSARLKDLSDAHIRLTKESVKLQEQIAAMRERIRTLEAQRDKLLNEMESRNARARRLAATSDQTGTRIKDVLSAADVERLMKEMPR